MARLPNWTDFRIICYEQLHGPLPNVVATQGRHLIPRPNTPIIENPFDVELLYEKLNALLLGQELRLHKYGREAETWPIDHTPTELREEYAAKSKVRIAAILEANTPSDCSIEFPDGQRQHLATPSPSDPEAPSLDTKDTFRKTSSGKVTKNAARRPARKGTRSGPVARTPSEASVPNSRPKRFDRATIKAQHQPGIPLKQRKVPPLQETPLRRRKTRPLKQTTVKCAKPQGISKSRQTSAGRPKRSGTRPRR